ncbi:hypothetical protein MHYP_G00302890 [Metynnis hypsauchen]
MTDGPKSITPQSASYLEEDEWSSLSSSDRSSGTFKQHNLAVRSQSPRSELIHAKQTAALWLLCGGCSINEAATQSYSLISLISVSQDVKPLTLNSGRVRTSRTNAASIRPRTHSQSASVERSETEWTVSPFILFPTASLRRSATASVESRQRLVSGRTERIRSQVEKRGGSSWSGSGERPHFAARFPRCSEAALQLKEAQAL